MIEEQKKLVAKTVRELYLYPYRSKEENLIRSCTWMVSWIIGVAIPSASSQQVLGGAYFIFALSLLLEFVPERKKFPITRCLHGIFCFLLTVMLLDSIVLSFKSKFTDEDLKKGVIQFLIHCPTIIRWIVFCIMLLDVILVLIEVERYFYDEEKEKQKDIEDRWESERKKFLHNLEGILEREEIE